MVSYQIREGATVLGSFSSEASSAGVASGVASTLALGDGVSVHVTPIGSDWLVSYGVTVLSVVAL